MVENLATVDPPPLCLILEMAEEGLIRTRVAKNVGFLSRFGNAWELCKLGKFVGVFRVQRKRENLEPSLVQIEPEDGNGIILTFYLTS